MTHADELSYYAEAGCVARAGVALRMAPVASRPDILRPILVKGVILAEVGIIAGVLVSAAASMIASLLYGVRRMIRLCFHRAAAAAGPSCGQLSSLPGAPLK